MSGETEPREWPAALDTDSRPCRLFSGFYLRLWLILVFTWLLPDRFAIDGAWCVFSGRSFDLVARQSKVYNEDRPSTDAGYAMAMVINEAAAPERANGAVPPLEQGDRLTRVEFERRYEAMRHLKKAELIEGRVYVPPPVKPPHGRPHARMTTWLGNYEAATPGVASSTNTTVRFDEDNEPRPDVLLAIEPSCGGQSHVDEDGYLPAIRARVSRVARARRGDRLVSTGGGELPAAAARRFGHCEKRRLSRTLARRGGDAQG